MFSPQRAEIKAIIDDLDRQNVVLCQCRLFLLSRIQVLQVSPYLSYCECSPIMFYQAGLISEQLQPVVRWEEMLERSHLDPAVVDLIHRIQLLEGGLARMNQKKNELAALIAPVHYLPMEVLIMIFEAGSQMPLEQPHALLSRLWSNHSDLPFPMLVASVCRRWRDIARHSPDMWTNIHLTPGCPDYWSIIPLQRSEDRPLDITLDCRILSEPQDQVVQRLLNMVIPHIDRWHSFSVIAHHGVVIRLVARQIANVYAPCLQHLRVSLTGAGPDGNQQIVIPPIFSGGTPNLVSVRFDSVALPWNSLHGLASLDLRWLWHRTKLIYPQFCSLLDASPGLTRLVLRGSYVHLIPKEHYPIIHLPVLRELEISGDSVCRMSALLSTPVLEALTLANIDDSEFRELLNSFHHAGVSGAPSRYPSLKSLTLLNVCTTVLEDEFILAFSATAFASISSLAIIHSGTERFMNLLEEHKVEDEPMIVNNVEVRAHKQWIVWPGLKTLTVVDEIDHDKLYHMVLTRKGMGAPLSRVVLHAAYFNYAGMSQLQQYVKLDGIHTRDRDEYM